MDERDGIRLEGFRQLREKIRGSKEYLVVGIDVAKESHHAFFGTATGKTLLRRLVFENSKKGFSKLLVQTEVLKLEHGLKEVVFGLEPTANYHKPLGEYLIKGGYKVVLVSGGSGQEEPGVIGRPVGQARHQGLGQCSGSGFSGEVSFL